MILPTKEKRIRCFVRGLRTELRIEIQSLDTTSCPFLDIVDHTRIIKQLHRETHGGNDKRAHLRAVIVGFDKDLWRIMIDLIKGSNRANLVTSFRLRRVAYIRTPLVRASSLCHRAKGER